MREYAFILTARGYIEGKFRFHKLARLAMLAHIVLSHFYLWSRGVLHSAEDILSGISTADKLRPTDYVYYSSSIVSFATLLQRRSLRDHKDARMYIWRSTRTAGRRRALTMFYAAVLSWMQISAHCSSV